MSISAKRNYYAHGWSYNEICVGCGCCKRGAYKERLEYWKYELDKDINFSSWCDDKETRKLQEKNRLLNIKYAKRKIKELKLKIKGKK